MINKTSRNEARKARHARIRNKVSGTSELPRLCVFRSNTNIYAQIIDDVAGNTLVSCSTLDKDIKTKHANKEAAKEVGAMIAKKALEKSKKGYLPTCDIWHLADNVQSVLSTGNQTCLLYTSPSPRDTR